MYKTVVPCSRAFLFVGSTMQKGSVQTSSLAATFTKGIVHPSRAPVSFPIPVMKQSCHKLQLSRLNFNFKDRTFRRKACGGSVGVAFSLSLLGFFNKEEELSVEDKILMEMKRAILAIQEGEIKKAHWHLDIAWKMCTEEDLEKAKTQILDIRANLAFQVGQLDAAEDLFKTVCQRLVYHQDVSVKDNAIIEISLKLAQILALRGRHEESMSGFQYCADTQREKIEKEGIQDEDTLLLAAWSLHSLAQEYLSRGTENNIDENLVQKASDLATEAHKYASKAIGPDSQQAVAISSDLASILALQGDIDAALERYKECEAIAAEKHTYLQPAIRVNTGSLYLQKGNYDEAERLCIEAKKLAGKYKDKESALRAEECIVRSNAMKTANADVAQQGIKKDAKSSSSAPG